MESWVYMAFLVPPEEGLRNGFDRGAQVQLEFVSD